jgi:hypothetical protein
MLKKPALKINLWQTYMFMKTQQKRLFLTAIYDNMDNF